MLYDNNNFQIKYYKIFITETRSKLQYLVHSCFEMRLKRNYNTKHDGISKDVARGKGLQIFKNKYNRYAY